MHFRSQPFEHAGIVYERASVRGRKIRQNERKNSKKHGKQAKLKAHISRSPEGPNPLLLSIRPASIIHWRPKSVVWSLYLCDVYKFHNLTALLSTA